MELITIILSSLLGILSPLGFVVDKVAENAIRDRLASAEQLAVRVDNAPSYQLLQGRVDQVRIAGRGIYPLEGVRIAALDVETDAIALKSGTLRKGRLRLDRPLQAGVRLVLTEADINRALQSPAIANRLRDFSVGTLGGFPGQQLQRYDFVNPQVEFLGNNRFRFRVSLKEQRSAEQYLLALESGLAIVSGKQLQLVDPTVSFNGQPVPPQLLGLLTQGISRGLDLSRLERKGITSRILKLDMDRDKLTLAAFVRLDSRFKFSGK
jgi:hypothetical protein